jgi:uncharacterized protein
MLTIKTNVGESSIPGAGKGLFAAEFIPKGKVVWKFNPKIDKTTPDYQVMNMSEKDRHIFTTHAYYSKIMKMWVMCGDDARFMNHSNFPNLIAESMGDKTEDKDLAAVDIHPGEEILCNYFDFDKDAKRKLDLT